MRHAVVPGQAFVEKRVVRGRTCRVTHEDAVTTRRVAHAGDLERAADLDRAQIGPPARAPLVAPRRRLGIQIRLNKPGWRGRAPTRSANSACGRHRRSPRPISSVDTHTSLDGTVAPAPARGTPSPPPAQCGRRRSESPPAACPHLAWRCPHASPVAGSSSPTTVDSTACRGSLSGWPRTVRATARRHRPRLGLPSPVCTRPIPSVWEYRTALHYPKGFLPLPVDLPIKLDSAAPSLRLHYRAFITTTGDSAPVPSRDTLALMGLPLGRLPSHRDTGSHVPHKSLDQAHAAFMPDAAWAVSRSLPDCSRDNDYPRF